MIRLTAPEAIRNAAHLKALGETTIYLSGDEEFPYANVSRVEAGSGYRLGGPSGCYLIAQAAGLTLKLNVEFEGRDANGRGVALFERDRLRELFVKLSPKGRSELANLFQNECLPALAKRRTELQEALNAQADTEDCVRGLILSAREKETA